jgi:hypothetical protein
MRQRWHSTYSMVAAVGVAVQNCDRNGTPVTLRHGAGKAISFKMNSLRLAQHLHYMWI